MSLKQLKILGVKVSSTTRREVISEVESAVANNHKLFMSTPNPEIIVNAQQDVELLKALNSADIALADGVGLTLGASILRIGQLERIPGRLMMMELLALANAKRWKVYILGSTDDVISKTLVKIKKSYPKVKISGSAGPLLNRDISFVTDRDRLINIEVLNSINKIAPDLLFVGFGAPKQEKWIYKNLSKLKVNVAMVVGGSFDYYVGKTVLPPDAVSRSGLEWLWRLYKNPKHLNRVLTATVIFPFLLLVSRFKNH